MTAPVNLAAHLLDIYDFLPLSNRNLIVDGNKDVWSSTAAVALTPGLTYTPSVMYQGTVGTSGVGTYGQGVFNSGAYSNYGIDSNVKYFGTTTVTTASTGTLAARTGPQVRVLIENVRTLAGCSATLSVWLWAPSAGVTITQVYAAQAFGTGGTPSSPVITLVPVNWVLTTAPKRYSVRLDIPSIQGLTIGTLGGDYLAVGVSLPVGSIYAVADAQWQLEQCSPYAPAAGMPTAFEYRGPQAEEARVSRYWEMHAATSGAQSARYGCGAVQTPTSAYIVFPYRRKRNSPSVTPSAPAGFYLYSPAAGNVAPSAIVGQSGGLDSCLLAVTTTGATAGQACFLEDNTGASSIIVDARL